MTGYGADSGLHGSACANDGLHPHGRKPPAHSRADHREGGGACVGGASQRIASVRPIMNRELPRFREGKSRGRQTVAIRNGQLRHRTPASFQLGNNR